MFIYDCKPRSKECPKGKNNRKLIKLVLAYDFSISLVVHFL